MLKSLIRTKRQISARNGNLFEVTYSPLAKRIKIYCKRTNGLAYLLEIDKVMKDFELPKLEENIMSCIYRGDINDFQKILKKIEEMN